jgi:hypothetical protein
MVFLYPFRSFVFLLFFTEGMTARSDSVDWRERVLPLYDEGNPVEDVVRQSYDCISEAEYRLNVMPQ